MIVVVTGMVGIDKKQYLKKVCDYALKNGNETVLCNVGDMIYAESPDIKPGKILDISLKRLSSLRRSVFKDIIAIAKKGGNLIVNTHATFRWRHGLFPAVDFDQMRQLNADIYINLVDGIAPLHHRLSGKHSIGHTLKDLILWREEEMICTEMLRNGIDEKKPLYCIARGIADETIESFYKLIFQQGHSKAYLSFPMTHVVDMKEVKKDIDGFRKSIKKLFTCFDPADLEESALPIYAKKAQEAGLDSIEVKSLNKKIKLSVDEVLQIERDINSQIYARDFLLIDQSDMIISYIPQASDGRAIISSGVERELQHAHEAAKDVYVIWNPKQKPSVFITQTATKVFTSTDNAIEFFKKRK